MSLKYKLSEVVFRILLMTIREKDSNKPVYEFKRFQYLYLPLIRLLYISNKRKLINEGMMND